MKRKIVWMATVSLAYCLLIANVSVSAKEQQPPRVDHILLKVKDIASSGGEPGLRVGMMAPDFTATSSAGNLFTLSAYDKKGPVVLIFYSGGWCPFCELYLQTLQRHLVDFKKEKIRVLAISPDSPECDRRLVDKNGLSFDIISDPQQKIIKAYNVLYEAPESLARKYIERYHIDARAYTDYKHFAIAIPAEYVIDKGGKIIYAKADFQIRARPEEILDLVRRKEEKS